LVLDWWSGKQLFGNDTDLLKHAQSVGLNPSANNLIVAKLIDNDPLIGQRAFVDENLFGKRYETLVEQTKAAPPWNGLGWQRRLPGTSMMPNEMGLLRGASAFSPELKELERELELR
jgi:hypothetical protein